RIAADRVDRLMTLVAEIIVAQAALGQQLAAAAVSVTHELRGEFDTLATLTRRLQDAVTLLRAQPVKPLFQRMERVLRESAQGAGKAVRLVTEGEETEIDRSLIDRLAEPLTHMIRNAVDHGIEPAPARDAAGKAETGIVRLAAAHRAGRVVVTLADDGGGIDRARVLAIARQKGLVAPGDTPNDAAIDGLIFQPGFSTRTAVTGLSGRGVGMDVVRAAIRALGGTVSLDNRPGRGTSLELSLPLTLAVLDAMLVRVGRGQVALPLTA